MLSLDMILPNELLQLIFDFIPANEIQRLILINHKFKELANDEDYWHTRIDYENSKMHPNILTKVNFLINYTKQLISEKLIP